MGNASLNPEGITPETFPDTRVLVVDDDAGLNNLIQKALRRAGFDTQGVLTGADAIDRVMANPQRILLLDQKLPDMTGTELIHALIERGHRLAFVAMTGHGDEKIAVEMMKLGARDYLVKGLGFTDLLPAVLNRTVREMETESRLALAEGELQRREARYAQLFNCGNDAIFVHGLEKGYFGKFTEVNDVACQRLGYCREELLKLLPDDIDATGNDKAGRRAMEELAETGRCVLETAQLSKTGKKIPVEVSSQVFESKGKRYVLSIARDITDRKQAEADRDRLLSAIEQTAEAIIITDTEGHIQYTNPAFEQITGYSQKEVLGSNPRFLKSAEHDDAFYHQMWQTITAGDTWRGMLSNRKKDGTIYSEKASISPVFDDAMNVVNFVAVKRDITDEIRMEEKINQSQKMEAIGTLAGGIAHDFNNILFPLIGYSEMLRDDLPADSPLQDHVDQVLQAAMRSKDLVQQILAFSRQGDQEIRPVKLQPIVKETLKLLRASIPTSIMIQQDIDPGCGVVIADPTQIHQTIMNLATNAYHAMEKTGGILTVNLKQIRLDAHQTLFPELAPGEYALLTVSDTGLGIDKNVMDKIFDPYFTTKEMGKGTGLGLSVVQGIVKSCNGEIHIESDSEKGTQIQVYLPTIEKKTGAKQADRTEPVLGGIERILLVDDEVPIIRLEQQVLERLGYRIASRTGSVEALEAFRANPDAFDLVVTDMTMPNMTGVQLAGEIKKIRPDIPVILCTGFSNQVDEEKSKSMGIQGYVKKPVIKKEIAEIIRKVLDKSKEG